MSCEAAREGFSADFNKTVHQSFISLHFKPFLVFISVLLKGISSARRSQMLWSGKLCLQWWLCFTLTKSWNRIKSGNRCCFWLWWRLQHSNCYSNFCKFVHVHRFLSSSPIQSDHPSSWHHLWHFKSRTREKPGLERPRAVWWSDPISQTKSPSLILIRPTHVVADFIYLVERDRPNLCWRLTQWKTVLKHGIDLLSTKNFAWLCFRHRPA